MKCITLAYGAKEPLVLEVDDDALVADCRGPVGVIGEAARTLVTAAVAATTLGPPLELHVVPGDRVVSVGARVPGRVKRYLVEEGDAVKQGQPLVQLSL